VDEALASGETPVYTATHEGHAETVHALLKAGANARDAGMCTS
jgi:hypothetical protein